MKDYQNTSNSGKCSDDDYPDFTLVDNENSDISNGTVKDSEEIEVKVEDEIIKVDKNTICKNEILNNLIEDKLSEKVLIINENVKKEGFLSLMLYYKERKIEIDDINVTSLFLVCFYYDEEGLLKRCIEYIIDKQFDVHLTIAFLKVIYVIKNNPKYSSLYQYAVEECKRHYNELIKFYILELDVEAIQYVLETYYLEIDSENLLVEKLEYYYENKSSDLDDDFVEIISSLINWNRVDENIKAKCIFYEYYENNKNQQKQRTYDRMYILEFPEFSYYNPFIDVIKSYYFNKIEFCDIEDETFNTLKQIDENVWFLTDCLFTGNVKLTFSVLRYLSDVKYLVNYFLNDNLISKLLDVLMTEYFYDSYGLKDDVMRCLTLFRFSIYTIIYKNLIDDIMDELTLRNYSYEETTELFYTLIYEPYTNRKLYNAIHSYLIQQKEPAELVDLYEDYQLKDFKYEKNNYKFHVDENIEIIPQYNNCKDLCIFSISPPDLPNGITFNRRNGIISGSTKEITSRSYKITCNCPSNKISFEMEISVGVLTQFSYPEAESSYNLNEQLSIIPICDGDYCYYDINRDLPEGLNFDNNSGIISGIVSDETECKEITVTCTDPNDKTLCYSFDLYFGTITKFFYPTQQLLLQLDEEIILKPIYDGNEVYFGIGNPLPTGLTLDTETGIIEGKLLEYTGDEVYEIYAFNKSSTKSTILRILSSTVEFFKYDCNTCLLTNNCELYLKPEINEGKFTFAVEPILNSETGEISGTIREDDMEYYDDGVYTITCSSATNQLTETLEIIHIDSVICIPEMGVISCNNNNIRLKSYSTVSLRLESSVPDVNFSINPQLPDGLYFSENGYIHGKTVTQSKNTKYKITYYTDNITYYDYINISIGDIIMCYYDKEQYDIKDGEKIDIKCHYDGDDCRFIIMPNLPPTVKFNSNTGRIHGIWDNKYASKYYITCENKANAINTDIVIRYDDITYFSYGKYYFKFNRNEYFSIEPETDGEKVKYSIIGEIPNSIKIDERNGVIDGSYSECKSLNFIVECRNSFKSKTCAFTIEFI